MRLPHITVEYRDTESLAPGKMSLSNTVGFGIHWALIFIVVYNCPLFFHFDHQQSTAFYVSLMLAYAAIMLLYALASETARKLFLTGKLRRRNRLIGTLAQVASFILLWIFSALEFYPLPLLIPAAMLYGIGGAILLMSFAVSSSVCDSATATLSVALSFLFSGIIYAVVLVTGHYSAIAAYASCILLPFAELLCLNHSSKVLVDGLSFSTTTIPVKKRALGFRIGAVCLIFGLLVGVSAHYAFPVTLFLSEIDPFTAGIYIVSASFCCCMLLIFILIFQRQTVGFVVRAIAPLIGLSFITILIRGVADSPMQMLFFSLLTYMLIESCIWVCLSDLSQRYRISAFPLFGFGRGFMALGTLIFVVLLSDSTLLNALFDAEKPLIAVALGLLVLGLAMLPRDSEMRRTLVRKANCLAPLQSESIAEDLMWDQKERDIRAALAEKRANEQKESEQNDSAPQEEDAQTQDAPLPAQNSTFTLEPNADDPEKKDFKGRYKRKCTAIADTYLLSRRETEVLFLLAKGFNNVMIQEKLFISEGTTNTHMRHIYQKVGVHSQQELIRLVESVEVVDE